MSKAARGTKRQCEGCGKKFYDLNRDPIVCPHCGQVLELKKPEPQTDGDEKEAVAADPVPPVADLPEAEKIEDAELEVLAVEDEAAELADIADDDVVADDDAALLALATEEDDETDVTDIIGDIPKDEEES